MHTLPDGPNKGDVWPSQRDVCKNVAYRHDNLNKSIKLSGNLGTVVQAGGNCGIFPRHLAQFFDAVYTFEPSSENFACLQKNCTDKNVFAFPYALGEKPGKTTIKMFGRNNWGDFRTCDDGEEEVQVTSIDSLKLKACDLIYLDVQGDELFVLKGGEETINRFKPVICVEWAKKVMTKYSPGDLEAYIDGLGYKVSVKGKDRIYVPSDA